MKLHKIKHKRSKILDRGSAPDLAGGAYDAPQTRSRLGSGLTSGSIPLTPFKPA